MFLERNDFHGWMRIKSEGTHTLSGHVNTRKRPAIIPNFCGISPGDSQPVESGDSNG